MAGVQWTSPGSPVEAGRAAAALGLAAFLLLLAEPALVERRRIPAVDARDRRARRLGHPADGFELIA